MAREFAKAFYKSKVWQRCRNEYSKSVNHLCEECMKKGLIVPGEIVHHIIELTPQNIHDVSITLGWDNLELVCRECHGKKHGNKKRFRVDEAGRVSPLSE